MRVIFNELAKYEFEDAIEFYELEYSGLGERFKEEIKKSIKRIVEYPKAWSVERGEIRKYLVHKFPYKILYSIEEDHIYIIAVAHQHRRPDYWIDRIKETNMQQLEKEFHSAMMTTCEEGVKRGYYPTYFMQMLHQYGGVETAKMLLAKREIQSGLMKLYELGLLDSSMEAYVIKEHYQPLFTEEECREAHRRLEELGYFKT